MTTDEASGSNPMYPEDIHFNPWSWLLVYDDGSQLAEWDEATGEHRNFGKAILARRVAKVALLPQYPERYPGLQPVVVLVPEKARPIVFRQHSVTAVFDPSAPIPEPAPRITGVGWQRTTGKRNQQVLLAMFDDGSMVLTDDRGKVG